MKKTVTLIMLVYLLFYSSNIFTNTSSPGGGYTDAPGEANCGNCHASPITSGSVWNNITLTTTVPFSGFIGGNTYPMTLTFSDPSSTKYGFQVTAVSATASASSPTLGTFSVSPSNTEVQEHNGYLPGRSSVAHTSSGTSAITNTKTWTFDWTAPPTISTTPVKFYVSINSTDNDNSTSGDQPYTKTFSATVMPVKWLDFTAQRLGDKINLNWKTASEVNNSHFEIEQSDDGEKWLNIGKVKGSNNSNSIKNYSFMCNHIANNNVYFRLKQVDFNGSYEYSTALVIRDKASKISNLLYWDNSGKKLVFNAVPSETEISIYNIKGELLHHNILLPQEIFFNLPHLLNGIYIIKANFNGNISCKKFIVY
ncbi:MAG: choice-of-anchor V domain-containing protein [Bacteroidia bacterium]